MKYTTNNIHMVSIQQDYAHGSFKKNRHKPATTAKNAALLDCFAVLIWACMIPTLSILAAAVAPTV